ncbi:MAG: hemerythrin family protein [Lachnospiraceae bacterium]|nr:hemerythrin family protein [Lachnospiraceae bacterium]
MFDFKFDWQPSMATGIEAVDTQHQQLLKIGRDIEQLLQSKCIGVTDKQLIDLICDMRNFTGYHFYTEESLMEECKYDKRVAHKEQHRKYEMLVQNYDVRNLKKDPEKALQEARELLQDVIFNHMLKEDLDFARAYHFYEKLHKVANEKKKKENDAAAEMFGLEVMEFDMTRAYLYKDQTYRGHLIVMNKEIRGSLLSMAALERNTFFNDVYRYAKALKNALNADALEYVYSEDIDTRMLCHIVPKFVGDPKYGKHYQIPEEPFTMDKEEYEALADQIRTAIV